MGLNELVLVVWLFWELWCSYSWAGSGPIVVSASERIDSDGMLLTKNSHPKRNPGYRWGWSAALTVIGQFRGVESGLGIEQPGLDCVLDHSTPLLVHLRQCQHRAFESKIHCFFKTGHGLLIILAGAVAIQIHAAQSV